ncbi:MAG: S8 family serine peptidase [Vicingaceae bacterium]
MKFQSNSVRVLFILSIFISISLGAQNNLSLKLKTGNVKLNNNIEKFIVSPDFTANELVSNRYYRIVQFSEIPTSTQKKVLKEEGITLLNYLPDNAFYASININADLQQLKLYKAIAVSKVLPDLKLNNVLASQKYPHWALFSDDLIEINAVYYSNINESFILNKLKSNGIKVLMSNVSNVVRFRVKMEDLQRIYQFPEFYYFEEKDMPGKPEGIEDRTAHRSNVLATNYDGGLKFDGTGVTVMLQDNSTLDEHIDYKGRFDNDVTATQSGDHGEHTGGIIAGAGNLDPKGRGMAHGADVLVYGSGNNNYNAVPALIASDDLTITSKSFGNGLNAGYTLLARQMDQQVRNAPQLIHVFSAGNSGSGWSTITGGHKQGKNVLAVGNVTYADVIASSSSRGPALDGRIKPDICGVGTSVYSTNDPNNYVNKTGTSMACPGVAGVLAQLYHAYKTENSGVNPDAALIKAAVLNTGEDLGNVGPDFTFGWGRINARRAYQLINNNNYFNASIATGATNVHDINVPVGTSQLRVMVYWSDYEGAASAAPALVNNIDMEVVDPGMSIINPWVLNPASQSSVAVRGVDNLNNMEQVTIDNPTAGLHTVNVTGTAIPQGPQAYYLVYEFIQDEVVLTYPNGGEGFNPGTVETIRWDSYGTSAAFGLEYSIDNGATWNVINSNVSSALRHYNWNVPATLSGEAKIRVTKGGLNSVNTENFSIIGTPTGLNVDWACVDSIQLSWNNVAGATSYEISQLGAKYMDSIIVSTSNSIVLHGINSANEDWFSVRSLGANNARGERAYAIRKNPGTYSCPISTDASLAVVTPQNNGSSLSCISSAIDITVKIKNEGLNAISNIPVSYSANGGSVINETYSSVINPGDSVNFTFTNQFMPSLGTNNILAWQSLSGDLNNSNDTAMSQFEFVNSTANYVPWFEDFESFITCSTASNCEFGVCNMSNDFRNEINGSEDDIDWRTDVAGTPSNGTGPSQDYSPGTIIGKYLYLESSSCANKVANLVSPCIDLVNIVNPNLSFAYHMSGASMGSLHVDVFYNGAWINDVAPVLSGHQDQDWLIQNVPLSSYEGSVINLRFRGVTGFSYLSDMAIDDIRVTGDPLNVEESSNSFSFSIYPNPSNGIYNYSLLSNEEQKIEIYDVNGRVIYLEKVGAGKSNGSIDISNYNNGIYMLVLTKGSERLTQRIIKK